MPATQSDDHSSAGTAALRIGAGLGTVTVSGLTGDERDEVARAWARCGVTEVELPGSADVDRRADGARSWIDWHENLVFLATSRAIAAGRGTHLMFHGACLADPDTGAGMVLAAASGTGKTTATRRLGPHYAYLTDETAVIDPADLTVTPYPKPLSVLGPKRTRPKMQRGPDELGLGPTLRRARLARIAVLDRVRDPDGPVPARAEPMPVLDALRELVPQTSSLARLPRGLVTLCRILDSLGGAQRLVYAEAEDLRAVVDDLLTTPPAPAEPTWEPLTEDELAAPAERPAAGAVARAAVDDGILGDDGRILLLAGTSLVALEGLGPAVWLLLDEPRTIEEIVDRLAEEGPVPADARERVHEAVRTMADSGLVTAP